MKNPRAMRTFFYLCGGGILLTWLDPPEGIIRIGLILAMIGVAAYLDMVIGVSETASRKVVSLKQFRNQKKRRTGSGGGARERRMHRQVFFSSYFGEVDALLQMLRGEGLHPMMVTQNKSRDSSIPSYRVMLPDEELPRARPLIDLFMMEYKKRLS